MIKFYIALAMATSTTQKLHSLSQVGQFDTPQEACEASARGEMTQVIQASYQRVRLQDAYECCERRWKIEEHVNACKARLDFKWDCWNIDSMEEPHTVALMNCISAPSFRVEEVKP